MSLPNAWDDDEFNIHVVIPLQDGSPSRVLWSCHTDTVHRDEGNQKLYVTNRDIRLDKRSKSNCLGADDGVGVWLCREMVLAGIPGHYVFHYGEESGGVGSSGIVAAEPQLFSGLDFAIAFDRRGYRDVITHQSGGRCCSDEFARSLAKQLRPVARYRPSDSGIYTDTAEYTGIIAECTNVSVGYSAEHRASESVDYWHALALARCLTVAFDESRLVVGKAPEPPRKRWRGFSAGFGFGYQGESSKDWDTFLPFWRRDESPNPNGWERPVIHVTKREDPLAGYLPGTFGAADDLDDDDREAIRLLLRKGNK